MKPIPLFSVAAVVLGCASSARAQDVDVALPAGDLFARDRNISVLERQNPEYSLEPIHVGSFLVDPFLTVATDYNSNIFAAARAAEGDAIVQVQPVVVVKSDWGRNLLSLTLTGDRAFFIAHPSQDTTHAAVSTLARWDVHHDLGLAAGFELEHQTEARTAIDAPSDAVRPIVYDDGDFFLDAVKQDDAIRLALRGDVQDYAFQNGRTAGGAVVYERNQDYTEALLTGRAAYAFYPNAAAFAETSLDRQFYRNTLAGEAPRDATGYAVQAGTDLDLTDLVRGEFAVGYLAQDYRARAYPAIAGIDASARLTYFVTSLVNLSLTFGRTIGNASITGVGGYLATSVAGEADYELLRNLKITATVGYENDAFRGYDRTDQRRSGGIAATWQVNRALSVKAGYGLYDFGSDGRARADSYLISDFSASATYHF